MTISKKLLLSALAGCALTGSVHAAERPEKGKAVELAEKGLNYVYGLTLKLARKLRLMMRSKETLNKDLLQFFHDDKLPVSNDGAKFYDSRQDYVRELLAYGASPNACIRTCRWVSYCDLDERALNKAAVGGDIEIVKLLLGAGASINARGPRGRTALHDAVGRGRESMVKLLLAHGADMNVQDENDETALDINVKNFLDPKRECFIRHKYYLLKLFRDTQQKRAKSRVLALEALAAKNGDTREDGTEKPFNVISLLPRGPRCLMEEFATSECQGYEGRGLSSERLNIEYRVQQKQKEQE